MKSAMALIETTEARTRHLTENAQSALLAAIRIYWGWQFAVTGWGKLQHLGRVAEFFSSLGIHTPHEAALLVGIVEFGGGVLLALGAGTRLIALLLFVNMSVAYWVADREALVSAFTAPEKFYGADPFPFWSVALLLMVFGAGRWAVDRLLGHFIVRGDYR